MKEYYIPTNGDIFSIKVDSTSFALGQVIYTGIVGLNIIHDYQFNSLPQLEILANMPIALIGYSTYEFIKDGRWKAVGNMPIPDNIEYPKYICETYVNGEYKKMVYGYDHSVLREANEQDDQILSHHTSYSPIVIEEAIKAKFGVLPWKDYYEHLLYKI